MATVHVLLFHHRRPVYASWRTDQYQQLVGCWSEASFSRHKSCASVDYVT